MRTSERVTMTAGNSRSGGWLGMVRLRRVWAASELGRAASSAAGPAQTAAAWASASQVDA